MTRDDIEAFFKSINFSTDDEDSFQIFWDFAKVVAAAERERIIAANAHEIEKVNVYIKALEDAVAAEREACAQTVASIAGDEQYRWAALAIRERGQA